MYVEELISSNLIVGLLKNNYGNYVIQRVLRYSTGNYKLNLINLTIKNMEKLGDRRLILKWKGIIDSVIIDNHNIHNKSQTENFYYKDLGCSPISTHSTSRSFRYMNQNLNVGFKQLVFNKDKRNNESNFSRDKNYN